MLSLSGVAPRNFVEVGSPTGVAEVKSIPPSAPVIVPDKSKPLTSVHGVDVMPDANGMFGTQASGMPEGSFRLQVARFIPQTILDSHCILLIRQAFQPDHTMSLLKPG